MSKVLKKNRIKLFEGTQEECEHFCRVHSFNKDPKKYTIVQDAEVGEVIEVVEPTSNTTTVAYTIPDIEEVEMVEVTLSVTTPDEEKETYQQMRKRTFMEKLRDKLPG